jgi:hypothetical protein
MKRKQAGVSLSGLLGAAVVVAFLALLGMKVMPEVIEYFQIVKAVKSIKNDPNAQSSVAEVRRAFDRHATVDNISAISSQDLDITKEGGAVVVSFAYERRVHLFGNVSLLLEFQGSSRE